jgi:site-specific recombinase XerD
MLRHARAYDLIVLHGYKKALVQQLLNWDSENMVDHYTDIRDMLKESELIQEYERTPENYNMDILIKNEVVK